MARLLEGEISAPLRIGFRIANDNVIQQFDFENLGGLPQRTSLCELPNYGNCPTKPMVGLDWGGSE